MSQLDLARLQFAMTSIYHFLFVPVTIGVSGLTAVLQTAWYRTKREEYLRLTRFFGTLMVISIAVGVVTGLVQEFQFGMDWSHYSRTVGNVFGGPLALEGLAAFFLESTFLGLWLFGWDKLSPRLHLATVYAVVIGGALSAAFIMSANSWMQHPVGYQTNAAGQPQLNDFWALFTNPVFLRGYLHVLLAGVVTGSVVMLAVSAWQLRKGQEPEVFRISASLALLVLVPSLLLAMLVGSELGVTEGKYQPMKIAGAEAQWTTCQPCSFSMFQIGGGNKDQTPTKIIAIPHLLSLLATNHWNGKVLGLNPVNAQYNQQFGPGYYVPNIFIQYWSMRVMAYLATVVLAIGVWGIWLLYRRKLGHAKLFQRVAVWAAVLPFLMNTAGWLLTENGRQPWIVQGLMLTSNGLSPSVSTAQVATSIIVFLLLYAGLAIVAAVVMAKYARKQLAPARAHSDHPIPAVSY
ncbi:cytochrome ubiquinol oxidase subunit I [Actinospica robiniae]|uniref:cytochrome ubiquinol oxidase subunit I n=1 Tax=Actinospica robiniae TaxID=304901 RepID=UPI0003FAE7EA|nr:cytochrome ubiquinol oxidase subunit I [Actinospica robiniae]